MKVDPKTNVRAGTPGRRAPDQVSREADGTDLVLNVARILGVVPKDAKAMVEQAERDVAGFMQAGWAPLAVMHLLAMEMALVAHKTQTDWEGAKAFLAINFGPYFDAYGRWHDRHAEAHEVRDATQGMVIAAGPGSNRLQ